MEFKKPRATLAQKIEVLDYYHGSSKRTQHETFKHFQNLNQFSISPATLSNWVYCESQIREEFSINPSTTNYKKKPVLKFPEITNAVERHIKLNFKPGDAITDKLLRGIFVDYCIKAGINENDFKLSAGMLHSFKRRNFISKGRLQNQKLSVEAEEDPGKSGNDLNNFSQNFSSNINSKMIVSEQAVKGINANNVISNSSSTSLNQSIDFSLDDVFNYNNMGFGTRLIHSDDVFFPLLQNMPIDSMIEQIVDFPQPAQTDEEIKFDSNANAIQESSVEEPTKSRDSKRKLPSYPTYTNPFQNTSHYKRRAKIQQQQQQQQQQHTPLVKSNPNSEKIETILETITEGKVTLYNSGTSAIMGILIYLNPKRIFIDDMGYRGTHHIVQLLGKLTGVKKFSLNELQQQSEKNLLDDSVIILESPQNPLGYVYDLSHFAKFTKLSARCKLIVDSTLAPPPLQFPLKYGAHFTVYSAVKYLAGVSDLSAGFVVSRKSDNLSQIELHKERFALGTHIASFDSFLLLRSLRTYKMRIITQCQNTKKIINYLSNNYLTKYPIIKSIYHASLQENQEIIMKQLNGFYNPVFGLEFSEPWMGRELLNNFNFLSNNPNLEGGETLVELISDGSFLGYNEEGERMVRFSVGCEDVEDILRDIDQALTKIT
ncbi:hypothetical protein DAMA08_048850 [Martiniozyma asiatica (nom. inval.)]|nr:hypothetical protein DAMA08_048850 [Martiniozyma asiatica]